MAEARAFKRISRSLKDVYNASKAFSSETTTYEECESHVKILDSVYQECLELEKIAAVTDENEKCFEDFYVLHNSARKRLLALQCALSRSIQTSHNESFAEACENQTAVLKQLLQATKRDEAQFAVPKIPSFSGNSYAEYSSFRNLFTSIIHNNEAISYVRKLQILKGLCKEKAYNLIKHVDIDETNYEPTLALLDERFGRCKQVLTSYIKRFFEQPTIMNPTSTSFHQMYDISMEILNGLKTLGESAQTRDPWLILILLNKLDINTRVAWAKESEDEEYPTIELFLKFLARRGNNMEVSFSSTFKTHSAKGSKVMQIQTQSTKSCLKCKAAHNLYECKDFLGLSIHDRRGFIASNRLCFNCLSSGHNALSCRSQYKCRTCNRKHHTSIHSDDNSQITCLNIEENQTTDPTTSSQVYSISSHNVQPQAVLPTVRVQIRDSAGKYQQFRALIDSGAQNSLITERCAQNLSLSRKTTNINISGISGHHFKAKGIVNLTVESIHDSSNTISVSALVVSKLPDIEPVRCEATLQECQYLPLADPNSTETTCDLLLGADICFKILQPGQQVMKSGVIAQNTIFGWILVGGSITHYNNDALAFCTTVEQDNLEQILQKFWSIEQLETKPVQSPQAVFLEDHFKSTTTFTEGRFTTRIPFKPDSSKLGDSYHIAERRFLSLERKMQSDESFRSRYIEGMNEYLNQQHMIPTPESEINDSEAYFLPHHPVFKMDGENMKLRIVFDGSCKTSNGTSLNDKTMVGPVIQPTLWQILMRFRLHPIALTADIQKMYLQIKIHRSDQKFQRLLWRENPTDELRQYQLTTVTFGLSSSPFLATRALLQVAMDNPHLSEVANEIKDAFYVDDYISGTDSTDQAKKIKQELTTVLKSYGFSLRKWKSNCESICEKDNKSLSFENSTTKVLGLQWCPKTDSFSFIVQLKEMKKHTKRTLLSETAQVYDPLGWLAPTIILFKMMYQRLWRMKLGWDDCLPPEIASDYQIIRSELPLLQNLKFPRFIQFNESTELHGFSDASENAYGAVIYARTKTNEQYYTILVTCKTKVAPPKPVSIARLELCAAQLLAKLMHNTMTSLRINSNPWLWTDSQVVLAWLSEHPSNWKPFVANRCTQIEEYYPRKFWNYVSTKNNPADHASRGKKPSTLLNLSQWWHGPTWLSESNILENVCDVPSAQDLAKERKAAKLHVLTVNQAEMDIIESLFENFSCYGKIRRILAHMLLFISKLRSRYSSKVKDIVECLDEADQLCIKWAQSNVLARELQELRTNGVVKKSSSIASLYPFLDDSGVIRVGGRLKNAKIDFAHKHPAVIPKSSQLAEKLIWHYHNTNLHCGPSLTYHILRQKYWVIHGRSIIRKLLRNCVKCFKHNPIPLQQLMGHLPTSRVTLTRAFHQSGVDYAGPIEIASKVGRGCKIIKGYIAIFVCMSTKAVHLEAVSDLTTSAFLAAFTRFSSRRGVPHTVHSDNAKNFVGANNRLNEIYQIFNNTKFNQEISSNLSEQAIRWKFITPLAPHEGGLWEAAVKSVKALLLKASNSHHFTLEELSTMLCKIEAVLNSRPLYAECGEDAEFNVLTPNHFLNGTSSNLIPEHDVCDANQHRLDRWHIIQQQTQRFWQRYNQEYLNSLQQRTKWHETAENIQIGDIVLLQTDQVSTYKWPVGRIVEIFPDSEGLIRQANVKTSNSILKRSIRKMCKVPIS